MASEHRPLLLRANRLLGANLVEQNLVKLEDLEAANERLLEIVAADQPRQSTLLGILAYQMKVLREDDVMQHCVESDGLGLVDIRDYDVPDELKRTLESEVCWATWSVPFDHEEDFYFVATAYYLSPAVRTFWEKRLGDRIIWYGTSLEVIADFLERFEQERAAAAPKPVTT